MRKDFNKVLTERPRVGHNRKYKEVRKKHLRTFDPARWDEEEDGPYGGVEGMKQPYDSWDDRKTNTDLWSAIRRFMASRVGRLWDDVWSEVNRDLEESDDMRAHWRVHCKIEVDEKLKVAPNGRLYRPDGSISVTEDNQINWDMYRPNEIPGCRKRFYADPRDGILKKTPPRTWGWNTPEYRARELERLGREHGWVMNDGVHIKYIDGVWYALSTEEHHYNESVPIYDDAVYPEPRKIIGYRLVPRIKYKSNKRQLNTRDLKKYGVRNA